MLSLGFLSVTDEVQLENRANIYNQNTEHLFYYLENRLLYQSVSDEIIDSINLVDDKLRRDYLNAILKKRNREFSEAFELLFSHLESTPANYNYYDELVFDSKAAGKQEKLSEKISTLKSTDNNYLKYLKALISFYSNDYSKMIELLKNDKSFHAQYLLAYAYRGLGDYNFALTIIEELKKSFQSDPDKKARSLIAQGSLFLLSGDNEKAKEIYNSGLDIAISSGNLKEQAKAKINLAILDDNKGDFESARSKFLDALSISQLADDLELQGTAFSELGVSFSYTNNLVEARKYYEKSFEILKTLKNNERLSNLSANIASIYAQIFNYPLALSYYESGLKYAGENVHSKIINLRGLGDVYANLSNYSRALELYNQAKQLASSINNVNDEASVDISLGTLYYNVNSPKKALESLLKVNEKSSEISDHYLLEDLYFKIGLCYSDLENYDEAISYFNRTLNIAESQQDIYYQVLTEGELGYTNALNGKSEQAKEILSASIFNADKYNLLQLSSTQNMYLGKIYESEMFFKKAEEQFNRAIKLAKESMDFNTEIECYYLLGKLYADQNRKDKAESNFLAAINIIDQLSEYLVTNSSIQISHFSGLKDSYTALIDLYLIEGKTEKAFEMIEKSRSRNTYQNLIDLKILESFKDKDLLTKYYDLKWALNFEDLSQADKNKYQDEFEDLEKKISTSFKVNKRTEFHHNNFEISKLQKSLTEKENYISLNVSDNAIYLFNVSNKQFSVNKINISREELNHFINKLGPMFDNQSNSSDIYLNQDLFAFNSDAANKFYNKILKQTFKTIPAGNSVVFSLPAEMAVIPLEFLVISEPGDDSPYYYSNKKFLIDDYSISYTPSASILMYQKQKTIDSNNKILLVGDPQISSEDFALSYRGGLLENESLNSRNILLFPLRYSKQEIENVNRLISNTQVLLSDNATEENFKNDSKNSQIIHLSTHSFLFKNQPLIIFSKSENDSEDGYLEMSEILNLDLNTDLVVLSSCRSGLGTIDESEGIIGMQKSFYEAGAKSVVVSLWDVNDKYTSIFMQSFYKYLSEGNSKTDALRKAKIFFKKNYSANPYYWAAFVLSGDISKLNLQRSTSYSLIIVEALVILLLLTSIVFYNKYYKNKPHKFSK